MRRGREIVFQDESGLAFWAPEEVASFMPEWGRWRAVTRSGELAYRPEPPPEREGWVRCGPGWVRPDLLRCNPNGEWLDPAGFVYAAGPLADPPVAEPEAPVAGLPCLPGQILSLQGVAGEAWWNTDLGRFPAGAYAAQAARLHPDLVPAGRGVYVNRRRLRHIESERKRFRVVLDDGSQFTVSYGPHTRLAAALGLPHLYFLEPHAEGLYREGMRDYPYELALASGQRLRADFSSPRRLIAHLIWQTLRYRQQGLPEEYGREYRAFWYQPLAPVLYRAGMLDRAALRLPEGPLFWLFQEVLGTLIGQDRLFTFQQLGFDDPRPDLRRIGERRPEVLLVAEKSSLKSYVWRASQELGISALVLGGLPSLLSSEYCALALRERGVRRVEVLAFVDYDPQGWIAARSVEQQLRRYGLETGEARFLVRPECFTAEELALWALPITASSPQVQGKIKVWLAETGGVGGKAMGIHADHLRPWARFEERLRTLFTAIP